MQHVSLEEARARFDNLIQLVVNGDEIVITQGAVGIVKMTPLRPTQRNRKAGSAKGIILSMADDFDAPLEEFREYME